MGPSLTLTVPVKSSPSTESMAAPGMHGPMLLDVEQDPPRVVDAGRNGEGMLELHGSVSSLSAPAPAGPTDTLTRVS